MSGQPITITLPDDVYQQVQKQSEQKQRSIAEEVVAVITASFPPQETLPDDIESELRQLELLSDDELWQAAEFRAPDEKAARMQELVEKQQLEGLTTAEREEAALLSHFFNRVMLVRAKAAVLLQERGHCFDLNQA